MGSLMGPFGRRWVVEGGGRKDGHLTVRVPLPLLLGGDRVKDYWKCTPTAVTRWTSYVKDHLSSMLLKP